MRNISNAEAKTISDAKTDLRAGKHTTQARRNYLDVLNKISGSVVKIIMPEGKRRKTDAIIHIADKPG